MEFEILFTQPHTLDSIPNRSGKPDNHDRLGLPYNPDGSDRLDDTNGSSRLNNLDRSGGPDCPDRPTDLMTHTGWACLTSQLIIYNPSTLSHQIIKRQTSNSSTDRIRRGK